MNPDITSLEKLHDIILPPAAPWWPPAPGWYLLLLLLALFCVRYIWRRGKQWQMNAYRRAALKTVDKAQSATEVAEVLRRCALATTQRGEVAVKTGSAWANWLVGEYKTKPIPDSIREELTTGVYRAEGNRSELTILKAFAADWITHHQAIVVEEKERD